MGALLSCRNLLQGMDVWGQPGDRPLQPSGPCLPEEAPVYFPRWQRQHVLQCMKVKSQSKPEIVDYPKRKMGKINKPTKMNIQRKTTKAKHKETGWTRSMGSKESKLLGEWQYHLMKWSGLVEERRERVQFKSFRVGSGRGGLLSSHCRGMGPHLALRGGVSCYFSCCGGKFCVLRE